MEIKWFGHSFFQILAKGKDEKVSVVVDPFSKKIGLKPPTVKADILLVTHHHFDHDCVQAVKNDYFFIDEPGEYETKGVFIQGIFSFHDDKEGKERGENVIYKIVAEEIGLVHLGDLGQRELEKEQIEKIGEVDVLMVPVGGVYTICAKEAKKIVEQLKPKIVIPMHYALPGLKVKLEKLENFLKIMGEKGERMEKLKIKKSDLEKMKRKIVVLNYT